MTRIWAYTLALAATALSPAAASAAPAQANGAAQALVVSPGSVVPISSLRFGQFIQPATAGTLSISIAGVISAGGGVAGLQNITQTGTGRGPGSFTLVGTPNRQTDITLPASATISNGTQTMTMNAFTSNANGGGKIKLSATTGQAVLIVGATLNVAANQPVGNYTGTYTVTVAFQ